MRLCGPLRRFRSAGAGRAAAACVHLRAGGAPRGAEDGAGAAVAQSGAELVIGVRGKYEKHGFIAKLGSKWFYRIMGWMGVKDMVPGSTDFRLIDRCVADEYNKLTEHGRITRGLMDWMGFRKEYIDYVYGNRLAGKPSYNFKKLFQLAIDSFISLSTTPLMIFAWNGS